MNTRFLRLGSRCLMLLTGIATVDVILAQQIEENGLEEITVTAPRLVTKQVVGRTPAGSEVELIALQRRVSYADLDLALHANVAQLEAGVNDVAKEACDDLAKMYPLSDPDAGLRPRSGRGRQGAIGRGRR